MTVCPLTMLKCWQIYLIVPTINTNQKYIDRLHDGRGGHWSHVKHENITGVSCLSQCQKALQLDRWGCGACFKTLEDSVFVFKDCMGIGDFDSTEY